MTGNDSRAFHWVARLMKSGDIGVDIFFVLSGFLISFILLKEFKKYNGRIDVWNFYRGRFLRLWPMVAFWIFFRFIVEGFVAGRITNPDQWKLLSVLLFANNWTGTGDQGWSLAVEFQFYIVSPLLVFWMARAKPGKAIWMPIVMAIICLNCRIWAAYFYCPKWFDATAAPEDIRGCDFDNYELLIYIQTWTRMAPYCFGMYSAYTHVNDKNHEFMTNTCEQLILEWISFGSMIWI